MLMLRSRVRALLLIVGLLLVAASTWGPEPAPGESWPNGTVPLAGHVLPALKRAKLIAASKGRLESREAHQLLTLTVVLKRASQDEFNRYLRDLYDSRSPRFHHFLGQREIADKFGPTKQAYQAVLRWLEKQGFVLEAGSDNRLTLTVQGTIAQAEKAFGVRIADYRLGKRTFFANDRDPILPVSIASHVQAVIGLSDFAHPVRARPADIPLPKQGQLQQCEAPVFTSVGLVNAACTCAMGSYWDPKGFGTSLRIAKGLIPPGAPPYFSQGLFWNDALKYQCAADELNIVAAYAANAGSGAAAESPSPPAFVPEAAPSGPGAGQKVGLLEFDNFHFSDVQDFLNLIGSTSSTSQLSRVNVAGGAGAPGAGESEVLLDIDAVMSLAPGAQVIVYDAPFTGRGSFQTIFNKMISDRVDVISNSWAYCENQTTPADVQSLNSILANAIAAGITVVTGAGDSGSTCLNGSPNTLSVPADLPNITAVGGTSLVPSVLGNYGKETWWDGSKHVPPTGQGGFGLSAFFARPSYQDGLSAAAQRSVPDVSAPADPVGGFSICQADAGGCQNNLLYGGTSVAAPIWGALVAVLNQRLKHNVGFLNASLYPLANTEAFHSAASMGSDFAHVGLGSPSFSELSLALSGGAVGAVDINNSIVAAFPLSLIADGTSQAGVAVVLADSNFNTVSGHLVTLKVNVGSHAVITPINATTNSSNGAALFAVTDKVPEVVTFTASFAGGTLTQNPAVTFVSPPAAAGGIAASPTTVTANGTSTSTITVTLQNAQGKPSPGKLVGLSQGDGSSIVSGANPTTDATGKVHFTATNTVAESVVYTATDVTDGNLPVPGSTKVNFVNAGAPPPCNVGPGMAAAGFAVTTFASGFQIPSGGGCVGPVGLAFDAMKTFWRVIMPPTSSTSFRRRAAMPTPDSKWATPAYLTTRWPDWRSPGTAGCMRPIRLTARWWNSIPPPARCCAGGQRAARDRTGGGSYQRRPVRFGCRILLFYQPRDLAHQRFRHRPGHGNPLHSRGLYRVRRHRL